jgi:hypothetical protein
MKSIKEKWLCEDCTQAAVNDDFTGIDYYLSKGFAELRIKEIEDGLECFGRGLYIGDGEREHSIDRCDCCHNPNHGKRQLFFFDVLDL